MSLESASIEIARDRLAAAVKARDLRIIFAESCTAGLCSATMAQVEGISSYLCGSAATYVPELKQAWLKVRPESIEKYTCESQQVADEMAAGVLDMAEVAQWSAAVVGHLAGDLKCRVYVAIARRDGRSQAEVVHRVKYFLHAATRQQRQFEAAEIVLDSMCQAIEGADAQ